MPTYEYVCRDCGTHVEVYQRFSDDPLTVCAVCGGQLRKVFHPAGILFKGSGFYATDSRRPAESKTGGEKEDRAGKAEATTSSSPSAKPSTSDAKSTGSTEKSA